ncbi:MAG: hypothetical protein U0234_21020 [Sandaracinus sp.]
MSEVAPVAILAHSSLRCTFCGATEELPAEAAARVTRLRARLAQIRWAEQAEEGPALAYARLLDTWKKSVLPMIGLMGLVGVLASLTSLAHALDLQGPARIAALVSALAAPLHLIAILGGVTGGFLWAMGRFVREVQPTLEARPSFAEGGSLRCRSCGGDLPRDGRAGFIRCGYCAADNLVTEQVAHDRRARLDRELADRQARAAGTARRVREGMERYTRTLYVSMGAAVGISLALSLGTTTLLSFLIR